MFLIFFNECSPTHRSVVADGASMALLRVVTAQVRLLKGSCENKQKEERSTNLQQVAPVEDQTAHETSVLLLGRLVLEGVSKKKLFL